MTEFQSLKRGTETEIGKNKMDYTGLYKHTYLCFNIIVSQQNYFCVLNVFLRQKICNFLIVLLITQPLIRTTVVLLVLSVPHCHQLPGTRG